MFTMEYYSTIERNAFESVLMRLINLGSAIQSEVSQNEKRKYCLLTHVQKSRKMVLNLFAEPQWRCRLVTGGEQTCRHNNGKRGGRN